MLFSSPIFLFAFLPLVLFLYYIAPKRMRNFILLSISLLFYACGEVFYVAVMLVSIMLNYLTGLLVGFNLDHFPKRAQLFLIIGVTLNLCLLVSFKYANFIVDNINKLLELIDIGSVDLAPVHLPLGISFFTFQALSYVVDVYRKEVPPQKNIFDLALFVTLFPQLIAGPIVRYHDIVNQFKERFHSTAKFAEGIERFIFGLAKKMLIANPMGQVTDVVFALKNSELTSPIAWIGIIAYALQIYFDFSGYSDMAIGLGKMFGFEFLENFNYPYISTSVREFWRRWHISLSTWFRDYVYIPLGGSRVGPVRVYVNLFTVFVLTGIWHGASWNFLVWGLFHGVFLACEHAGFSKVVSRLWKPLQHFYLLFVVLISWVFFKAENLGLAIDYLSSMFNPYKFQFPTAQLTSLISNEAIYVFVIGCILATPIFPWLAQKVFQGTSEKSGYTQFSMAGSKVILITFLLLLAMLKIAASTYNPFIYFRF
ncbi:MAG: MBOAT family O-acyltransferase [Verrucomicrobiota bacterium]|nr:MBOAT family O-acyltransferase [Verrucomicrobiota bacterium]